MRLTPIQIMLSDENWLFILDSLNDRFENLTALHELGFEDFTEDIKHCESLMTAIEGKLAD